MPTTQPQPTDQPADPDATDQAATDTSPAAASTEPAEPTEPEAGPFDAAYVARLRSEAAENRRERRAVTETLTAVQAELAELRAANLTAAIRAAATGLLADPDDLEVYVDRAELADEAGRPEPAKITAAIEDLLRRKPHLGPRPSAGNGDGGIRSTRIDREEVGIGSLLRKAARGE